MYAKIVGIIWTFNPNVKRLAESLDSVRTQVNHVVIVDNGSANINEVKHLSGNYDNVELIELGMNLGVKALEVAMNYAVRKFDPDFIFLLDDDTVVYPNAILKVLKEARNFKLYDRIGVICMSSTNIKRYQGKLVIVPIHIFSGCLVKTHLIKAGIRVRSEFFLDQADHDFYAEIKKHGFLIAVFYGEKLLEHMLGKKLELRRIRIPGLGTSSNIYEPPWRYYYIVRNSTVLLMEGKLNIRFYIHQLYAFFVPLLVVDGVMKALKALVLGLSHGLFKKLGYLDPHKVNLLSTLRTDRLQRGAKKI